MGLNTSAKRPNEGTTEYYGDADYNRDKAAGMSDADILAQINAEPGRMGDGGVGGNLYNRIAAGANSSGGSGGTPSGGYAGGSVGPGAGAYNPGEINFNPGGIDMGGQMPTWSNQDFIAGLAEDRAEAIDRAQNWTSNNTNQNITNTVSQYIGNKGDMETNVNNSTLNNVSIGNDYSLALGNLNIANQQFAA